MLLDLFVPILKEDSTIVHEVYRICYLCSCTIFSPFQRNQITKWFSKAHPSTVNNDVIMR
jgi:hypothetical protein